MLRSVVEPHVDRAGGRWSRDASEKLGEGDLRLAKRLLQPDALNRLCSQEPRVPWTRWAAVQLAYGLESRRASCSVLMAKLRQIMRTQTSREEAQRFRVGTSLI